MVDVDIDDDDDDDDVVNIALYWVAISNIRVRYRSIISNIVSDDAAVVGLSLLLLL